MNRLIRTFACLNLCFILTGCCANSTIVLIPDYDGHVGKLLVTTEGGKQVLSEANQSVEVMDRKEPPGKVTTLSDKRIRSVFAEALDARPLPPVTFILYFLPATNELTDDSSAVLPQIIKTVQSRPSGDIIISGHTDTVGEKDYNYQLALERAQTASQILVAHGANASAITVTSHGEGNPLIKTADEIDEPRNRRVEVTIR
ncbi:MAG TPA: OmpA family protein [Smithella sp.]|nr:OmpA family protein [Smithella sp.]MDM7988744.1 OmpA family protein [Smithella sp.]HNY49310.1 OmpA family protein [Smithella sp.]HOG89943.1 OmpA family protein [Smithella sp.]HQG66919.1 OmpA family protein [Smithella sp.]